MLQIKSIPAFDDNYIWLIQNRDRDCAVVDRAVLSLSSLTLNSMT